MWFFVFFLGFCFHFGAGYGTPPEIKINIIRRGKHLDCEDLKHLSVYVNQTFNISMHHNKAIYRSKCRIGNEAKTLSKTKDKKSVYRTPFIVREAGVSELTCTFQERDCLPGSKTICYYHIDDNTTVYADKEIQCSFHISVCRPDQITPSPTGSLTANSKSFNNQGVHKYEFYEGEPTQFKCQKNDGNSAELIYEGKDPIYDTKLQSTPSVEMYLKLTKAFNDGTYLVCLIKGEQPQIQLKITLILTYKTSEDRKPIGFAVNGVNLPVVIINANETTSYLEYEYKFYQNESFSFRSVNGDQYSGQCDEDSTDPKNSIGYYSTNKLFRDPLSVTLRGNASLSCTAVNGKMHIFHIAMKFVCMSPDFYPFIVGLSTAHILMKFTDANNSTKILYYYIRNEKLDLTCGSDSGAALKLHDVDNAFSVYNNTVIQLKSSLTRGTLTCGDPSSDPTLDPTTTTIEFIQRLENRGPTHPENPRPGKPQPGLKSVNTTPATPSTPATRKTPATPATAATLATPSTLATHKTPATAATPATPSTPTTHKTPASPATPARPTTTARPVTLPEELGPNTIEPEHSRTRNDDQNYKRINPISAPANPAPPNGKLSNETNNDQNKSTIYLIGICVAALIAVVAVLCIVICRKRQKRKAPHPNSSDVNYQCLPAHNEGPMPTPAQWNTRDNCPTYAVPDVNMDSLYSKPVPKSQRCQPTEAMYARAHDAVNTEPTYTSVGEHCAEPAYAVVQKKKGEPAYATVSKKSEHPGYETMQKNVVQSTYATVQKRVNEPTYAEVQKDSGNQNLQENQRLENQVVYAEVVHKSSGGQAARHSTVQGNDYANAQELNHGQNYANLQEVKGGNAGVIGDEKYANIKAQKEYAEPTYCELDIPRK